MGTKSSKYPCERQKGEGRDDRGKGRPKSVVRGRSELSTSQGTPRIAGSHQKLQERRGKDPHSELPEVTSSANTLMFRLLDF